MDNGTKEISAQATQELRLIEPIVSGLTGRPSLWNGVAEARAGLGAFGVKTFGCQIIVDADRTSQSLRWRTYIHEMLHAHTNGLEQSAVENYRGWEEGVVEQLQRLLRPQILAELSDSYGLAFSAEDEAAMTAEEANHWYNSYIDSLEAIRATFKREVIPFYLWLLSVPIGQRPAAVLTEAKNRPEIDFPRFVAAFIRENANLRRDINREKLLAAYRAT